LVIKHAYSPIELRWSKFLDGYGVGFFEVAFGYVTETSFAGCFFDVSAEACVWCLDDDGFAEGVEDFGDFFVVEFILVEEHRLDARNIVLLEECVLVDFVGADFDALRVVNDFESKFPSGLRHDVRREQRVSGGSNEDSVVVGNVVDVFSEEKVEFVVVLFRCVFEVLECAFFAWVGEVVFLDEAGDFTH
jgi:hypothetical protein